MAEICCINCELLTEESCTRTNLIPIRLYSYLLVASACSIAGSLLVEIFGFPLVTTVQMGHMCFVTALACGNWGMEVAFLIYFLRNPRYSPQS